MPLLIFNETPQIAKQIVSVFFENMLNMFYLFRKPILHLFDTLFWAFHRSLLVSMTLSVAYLVSFTVDQVAHYINFSCFCFSDGVV